MERLKLMLCHVSVVFLGHTLSLARLPLRYSDGAGIRSRCLSRRHRIRSERLTLHFSDPSDLEKASIPLHIECHKQMTNAPSSKQHSMNISRRLYSPAAYSLGSVPAEKNAALIEFTRRLPLSWKNTKIA